MKSVLIIGAGHFGLHMAKKFHQLNHDVLVVDIDEEKVNRALEFVTNAQIGDGTSEEFIRSLGPSEFDVCVVAVGDDFQVSLEAASLLKDNGAPLVVARASSEKHARFLLRNGADEIVYPEKEMAERAAVKYSSEHIFDYIRLSPACAIYEISLPASWVGKTIGELAVRQKYHIAVAAVRRGEELDIMPGENQSLDEEERLLIMGDERDIQRFLHVE